MSKSALRLKVEARYRQLESVLAGLRAEGEPSEAAERIEQSLEVVREAVRNGWDEDERVARRLGHWLKTTENLVQ